MKSILTILLAAVAALGAASAQNLAVAYTSTATSLKDGTTKNDIDYVLVADGRRSMFYNPEKWTHDSIMSTPGGKEAINRQMLALIAAGKPLNSTPKGYYVVKRTGENIKTFYDEQERRLVEEPFEAIQWQLTDSVKNILGYECRKASALYHGRNWTAWFSTEIPIQEGPWKLHGLPGLILEAEADGGVYAFKATAVGLTDEAIPPIFGINDFRPVDRIKYMRDKRDFTDHAMERLKSLHGSSFKIYNSDGSPCTVLYAPRTVIDFIETDY